MAGDIESLAPAVQETLKGWHRFVETKSEHALRPLFADTTTFRSPFVHLPIPGRAASVLILGAVVRIFENFRYHRTFVAGTHDVALEFSANIGDLQLKGVDLMKFRCRRQDRRIRGDDPPIQGAGSPQQPHERPDRTRIGEIQDQSLRKSQFRYWPKNGALGACAIGDLMAKERAPLEAFWLIHRTWYGSGSLTRLAFAAVAQW